MEYFERDPLSEPLPEKKDLGVYYLLNAYAEQEKKPARKDPYFAALSGALAESLICSGPDALIQFSDLVPGIVSLRRSLERSELNAYDFCQWSLRNVHARELLLPPSWLPEDEPKHYKAIVNPDYPNASHKKLETWLGVIQRILSDGDDIEAFTWDMSQELPSNRSERGWPLALAIRSEFDDREQPITVFDFAASDMQVTKHLKQNKGFDRKIFEGFGMGLHTVGNVSKRTARQISNFIYEFTAPPYSEIGPVVCTDAVNIVDFSNFKRTLASSFQPVEIKKRAGRTLMNEFIDNHQAKVDDITFYWGDLSRSGMANFAEETGYEKADVINISFMLYQYANQPETIIEMLDIARCFLKPGGMIFITDAVFVNREDPSQLECFPNRYADELYPYRVIVQKPDESDEFHEVLWSRGGRLNEFAAGPDMRYLKVGRELLRLIGHV